MFSWLSGKRSAEKDKCESNHLRNLLEKYLKLNTSYEINHGEFIGKYVHSKGLADRQAAVKWVYTYEFRSKDGDSRHFTVREINNIIKRVLPSDLKISTYYHINGKFTGKYVHSIPAKMTSVYTHHFVSEDGEPRSFTEKEIDSIVENNI